MLPDTHPGFGGGTSGGSLSGRNESPSGTSKRSVRGVGFQGVLAAEGRIAPWDPTPRTDLLTWTFWGGSRKRRTGLHTTNGLDGSAIDRQGRRPLQPSRLELPTGGVETFGCRGGALGPEVGDGAGEVAPT